MTNVHVFKAAQARRAYFFSTGSLFSGEEKEGRIDSKRGRIATNALSVPKDQVKGYVYNQCTHVKVLIAAISVFIFNYITVVASIPSVFFLLLQKQDYNHVTGLQTDHR